MNCKVKFLLCCLFFLFLNMSIYTYAEDNAALDDLDTAIFINNQGTISTTNEEIQQVTTYVDLIEYDVVYTVTTIDNITSLNASFTITNNEEEIEEPLLIAALYNDNLMVDFQIVKATISPGGTINETVSIIIPENKTEKNYIKLFVWEGIDSLRPIGKSKKINDIDSYFREKVIYITAKENTEFKVFMNAFQTKGEGNDVTHTIHYDPSKIYPEDLCGVTYEKEITKGRVVNTNIIIENVDFQHGELEYKFNLEAGRNTGITNFVKFKTLSEVIDEKLFYTIQ